MTDQEIRAHIFRSLARLYEDPIRQKQYYRFTFEAADKMRSRKIIASLVRNQIVEQIQPDVVRLTDLGHQLIQRDLMHPGATADGTSGEFEQLKPPGPEEIRYITDKLEDPDYISSSLFVEGRYMVDWATDGIKKVTGYTKDELNKAGGLIALVHSQETIKKLKQLAMELFDDNEIKGEIDIITKNGRKQTIQFAASPRYSNGQIVGSINAIKNVHLHG